MNLVAVAVVLFLSSIAWAFPLDLPKQISRVYLVPVFLPNQEIADNRIDGEHYRKIRPLQRTVIAFSSAETPFANTDYDQVEFHDESAHNRQRRSPVAGRRGGGGGGRGGGGGGGSSGSYSHSSSSSSSGSWSSGRGGGRGGGRGKGYGK